MKFTRTRIESGVDLDAEGKHYGFLRIPHSVTPVRPENSCCLGKIVMMESVNDWKLDNLARLS
jgi:hypothetical protein